MSIFLRFYFITLFFGKLGTIICGFILMAALELIHLNFPSLSSSEIISLRIKFLNFTRIYFHFSLGFYAIVVIHLISTML